MRRILFILMAIILTAGCCSNTQTDDWTPPLHEALRGATRLRVRSGGTCHRQPDEEKTLLDLSNQKQISEVVQEIQINPYDSGFLCMCCGNPTLEFYRDGTLIVALGFHHGESLRWPDGKWAGDGSLTDDSREFLISWMDKHGVSGPKEEHEYQLRIERQDKISKEKWFSAMPKSLNPFWDKIGGRLDASKIKEMNVALAKHFPDKKKRILALLAWYGSGEGQWSGYPSYEDIARILLRMQGTENIISEISSLQLTEQQMEGASRFFSCYNTDSLSEDFRQALLKHSLKSEIEDNRNRAQKAFGQKYEKVPTNP